MGGCNCKNGESIDQMMKGSKLPDRPLGETIIKYALKVFVFVLFLCALPIIMVYIVYLGFTMLVLNKNIDVKPALLALGKKFQSINNDDDYIDEDDYDTLTEDDVVLTNVEDITNKYKNKSK
jgi:hypothetical protein